MRFDTGPCVRSTRIMIDLARTGHLVLGLRPATLCLGRQACKRNSAWYLLHVREGRVRFVGVVLFYSSQFPITELY